jgi:hypothetical protein
VIDGAAATKNIAEWIDDRDVASVGIVAIQLPFGGSGEAGAEFDPLIRCRAPEQQ